MRSPLLRTGFLLATTALLLASCTPKPKEVASPEGNPLTDESGSVVIPVVMDEPVPSGALTLDEALSERFISQKLGIQLRYPKSIPSADCDADVPLQARELKDGVIFTTTYVLAEDCQTHAVPSPSDVVNEAAAKGISAADAGYFNENILGGWAVIHVRPAKNETELQAFVDAVFSQKCMMGERSENGENTRIFVQARPDFTDMDTSMLCGDSFTWNESHGVALYSSLGSKDGGGIEIAGKTFIDSSGQATQIYDFEIMRSLELL